VSALANLPPASAFTIKVNGVAVALATDNPVGVNAAAKTVTLTLAKPMVFGKNHEKGIKIDGWEPVVCPAAEAQTWRSDTHSPGPAFVMSQMDSNPELPRPIGIFRDVSAPTFDEGIQQQIQKAQAARGKGSLEKLIHSGETWTVS
jgi:2-oxoglutarate ferredoxin oxidoreductase subunit beta